LAYRERGIPGDTAEAGKERIQALLDEHRPTPVIVEIGGNDFLRRRTPKTVKEDVRRMIQAAKKTGAQVVLVPVPEFSLLGAVTPESRLTPPFIENSVMRKAFRSLATFSPTSWATPSSAPTRFIPTQKAISRWHQAFTPISRRLA
jgi:lysophospholipase L1-like esterase